MSEIISLQTRNGDFRVAIDGPSGAPVLLLSNSLGTPLEMWQLQVERFADHYRIVRYDTRGHGGSPLSAGPYRFDGLGDDVLAIMDALSIERAAFCGISMGGHTGLWLAAHCQERFSGVAVCNSAARIGTAQPWLDRAQSVRQGQVPAMRALADTAPQRWFTQAYIDAHPENVAQAQGWLAAIDPQGYAACCEALAESDLHGVLPQIELPVLLLAGRYDPVTTPADAERMQAAIRNASLAVVDASHLSNIEAPAQFDQALDDYLKALSR